ncbi:hypothetical protein DSD19_05450 [Rhodovulum sp. BSW8]|uniref:Uncharacterized protein n=1 Tax=Rhodovulum visakhapatnamense TaxID=364297 RepID=A0ABS1RPK9_9RHOB|nr:MULTISPECIES: hypothetical protein [Rhodovulum]MBL3571951.1 hypothetical protein [Rhodovulum visakhapatnamense]MBL3580576.1 hypothetical protein [Rhodovulum visakhapatnamense]OLS46041.1 hypothetical protein BV509_17880 [Rhodovulum sulfidophilum]RBO54168.1 hypothetical protein DSD19_05450 [Rhodovulum sp. BSW8]
MLMMTPAAAKMKRKLEGREREARRGRLGQARFDALAGELAAVIRLAFEAGATATLFGLEGPLRHGIRSDLCLMGWTWESADLMARELLDEAFKRVRAVRPTWNEGQPEWVIEAGTLIERTRCINCGKPLPEGHHKYCGEICADSKRRRVARIKEASEDRAVVLAIRST